MNINLILEIIDITKRKKMYKNLDVI